MTTAADIIVASVQANPPGGDVAVSPAVRVLVAEIVRLRGELATTRAATEALYQNLVAQCKRAETEAASLRGQLKHLGELSEADHNQLRERGDKAVAALTAVRNLIENDPDNLNSESMVDTIWIGPAETLVDYINAILAGSGDAGG